MIVSPIRNHPAQLKIWRDPARFRVAVCGRRFGKTFLATEMLLKASEKKSSLNVYIAPTRQQAKDILWSHLKSRLTQNRWKFESNESELSIRRKNGAKIILRSAEKPERIRGLGIDFAVFDEVGEYRNNTIWMQVVRPALADKRGGAAFFGTPKGMNFFNEIYNNAKTAEDWCAYRFRTIDNPIFQQPEGLAELDYARKNLSERDYKQEFEAEFITFGGRIYHAFERELCNTDYDFNPDNGNVFVGMDFNRSPMSMALFQKVAGKLIQFGEIFIRAADTQQSCVAIAEMFKDSITQQKRIVICPDATGKRRTTNSSVTDFDIIRSFGFSLDVDPINPRLVDRFATVNRCFEKKDVFINVEKCPQTVKDRETLVYREGTCEPNLNDPMAGHMADAADYAIMRHFHIFETAAPRIQAWR